MRILCPHRQDLADDYGSSSFSRAGMIANDLVGRSSLYEPRTLYMDESMVKGERRSILRGWRGQSTQIRTADVGYP